MKLSLLSVGSALLLACAGVAQAAVVQTNNVDKTSQMFFPVSNADLINQGQSTLLSQSDSGYTQFSGAGAATVLNDGSVGGGFGTVAFDIDGVYSFTYNLNTAVNTAGYDITSFATYTGWASGSGDKNRVGVEFTVSYTKVGGGSGTIGHFVNDPIDYGSSGENVSSETLVTLSDADIVSGVNSLTFSFVAPPTSGNLTSSDVSPILREIDASGTPTVPEPAGLSLLGVAGLALAKRRR